MVTLCNAQAPKDTPSTNGGEGASNAAPSAPGQETPGPVPGDTPSAEEAASAPTLPAKPSADAASSAQRTSLNLLGQVNSSKGEARRNENVQIDLIDNNVLKEMNQRIGVTATLVPRFPANQDFFGAEFGGSPKGQIHSRPSNARAFRGNFFYAHDNSALRARAFFQVGDVQPARDNSYGFTVVAPLWRKAFLTVDGSQQKLRGQVNGNVLIPLPDERSPLTRDVAVGARVAEMFAKYPSRLPNRPDINPRMLNANAPQNINNDSLSATLEQPLSSRDVLVARYRILIQNVQAFQLVSGQNPNTATKSHDARLTWLRTVSPNTIWESSLRFDRAGSLLTPDESHFGPRISTQSFISELGPGANIPIDRAMNNYHYASQVRQTRGRHNWYAGGALIRQQLNGTESDAFRGSFVFNADFGRTLIDNMRWGTPSNYTVQVGNATRGFRNWMGQMFVGDVFRATSSLTLDYGLRFAPVTAPSEVNDFHPAPYGSDWNNVSPRFGFAYALPKEWGVLRGAYGVQFGEIFPITFGQLRFNPPASLKVRIQAPNFLNPLGSFDPTRLDPNAQAEVYQLDPNLATPYSHQYNFSWERSLPANAQLRIGYVGSRSHKLLSTWFLNRGQPREAIPQTTATLNLRRADQRYYDLRFPTNASRGYYDAVRASVLIPEWRGLSLEGSYWFSKALDLGGNYTNTGGGRDGLDSRGQYEFDVQGDMRALSDFHQPHAVLFRGGYRTPNALALENWARRLFANWQASGVALWKSGTPFTLFSGSDGPGFGNVDGSFNDRVHVVDPTVLGRIVDHPDRSVALLPREAFAFMAPTDPRGNIGRNTFRRHHVWNVNASLSRTWRIHNERTLMLQAESLNLLNRAQFAEPGNRLSNPDFGQITNTLNDGRTFRFLARLSF
ncbi:MAG: hypothetical protein MUF01_05845 [Bryobacterales bacterium]|jgi:hypothetical protein|nr:hypothetical protein [Bryobacterales bacterium]